MKTIIITGGSEGLGESIAELLVAENIVYILARSEDKLGVTAQKINCRYKVCDVSDAASVTKVFSEIMLESGSIDVLINNAGLWIEGPVDGNNPDHIKQVIDVNLTGVINCTREALISMKKVNQGLIIQINSQSGLYGKSERSVYHASKWGVTGFTKSLQDELISTGIRVTGLYPGKLKTQIFSKQGIDKKLDDALDLVEVAKVINFVVGAPEYVHYPEIGIKHI